MRRYRVFLIFFLPGALLISVVIFLNSINNFNTKISQRQPAIFLVNETFSDTLPEHVFNRIKSQIDNVKLSLNIEISSKKNRIWTEIKGPRNFSDLINAISKIIQCDRIVWDDRLITIKIHLGRDLLVPIEKWEHWIKVRKSAYDLQLMKNKKSVHTYRIAVGAVLGDKHRVEDCRTPEGLFWVIGIEKSHDWVFDFGDGRGPIQGAYGPYFLRLYTGGETTFSGQSWEGIGIHGTHDSTMIGSPSSHGCIRMCNQDLIDLKPFIEIYTPVLILP